MASLIDSATEKFKVAAQARRDALRQTDEDSGDDRATAQETFEARRALEQAERERRRGPTIGREELARRETEKWDTVTALRNLRTELDAERSHWTAAYFTAVEAGDLASAVSAQQHLSTFGAIDSTACQRLRAHGVEVK